MTGRQDDGRRLPDPPAKEARFLVVPSARRLVVLLEQRLRAAANPQITLELPPPACYTSLRRPHTAVGGATPFIPLQKQLFTNQHRR